MPTNPQNDDLDLGATLAGFAPGQIVFGRYRLDRILGRGGMGVVWLAHDQEMGEEIALKFLPEVVRLDATGLQELKAETRKSRKLTHRNIVRVHDFVSDAHSAGISMEWVDGSTLSALRLTRPNMVFEPEDLHAWVKQVCEALEYAHFVAKLIHRDLKPANLMLTTGGEVKVADFGISSSLTESASRVSVRRSASGTLAYMSPQQALGDKPTVPDDVYSLGATIYELIAGKPPFFRGDLYAQVRDVIPPPMAERREESEIPPGSIPEVWEKTIAVCLDKDPAKRPQSAMEVAWRLGLVPEYEPRTRVETPKSPLQRVPASQLAATSPPATRPNPILIAAGALAIVLIGAAAWFLTRPHPAPIAVAVAATPTPAATVAPTSVPTPSPIAVVATPAPAPVVIPPVAAATPILALTGTVDQQLIGAWQSGATRATRKHWIVRADGRYLVTVAGTVTDSGTMSASAGHIQQLSRNSPLPIALTYQFADGDLITQGSGPFDAAEWHRSATTSNSSSDNSSSSSSYTRDSESNSNSGPDNGSSVKQQMLDNLKQRYGF